VDSVPRSRWCWGADAYSGAFRQTIWNQSIPPSVRGRMGGLEMISYALGPMAGQFRAGPWRPGRRFVSRSPLGSRLHRFDRRRAAGLPSLWRFDSRSDPHVAEVRELRERDERTPARAESRTWRERPVRPKRNLYASNVTASTFLVTVAARSRGRGC